VTGLARLVLLAHGRSRLERGQLFFFLFPCRVRDDCYDLTLGSPLCASFMLGCRSLGPSIDEPSETATALLRETLGHTARRAPPLSPPAPSLRRRQRYRCTAAI